MSEQKNASDSFDWLDAEIEEEKRSRLSGAVFFMLCAIPIFSSIAFGANETWALGLVSIFSLLLVTFWLVDAWLKKEFYFNSSSLQIPLIGLILIGLIQLLPFRNPNISSELLSIPAKASLSITPYSTRLAIIKLFIYLVFFAAALVFINNRKRLEKLVFIIIVFGSAMAFFGILQSLANTDGIYGFRPSPLYLPFASYINRNHFAAFMEMTIGVTVGLIFGQATKKDKRILLIIAVIIMGVAILLTGSRAGLLSLLGVIGFIITANLLGNKKSGETENKKDFSRNFAFIAGGLALIIVLFGTALLLGGDQSLIRGTGLQANQLDISNGRSHFWQVGFKTFLDYPIIGSGLDSFGTAFTRYDTWNGTLRVERAHNDYLQILSDAGILGFACVAGFIFLLFKKSLQTINSTANNFRRSSAIGALAGCFGIFIHSFFDYPLRTTANAFFFLLLVVIATVPIYYPKVHYRERK